jgi:hypothetical protein
MIRCCFHSRSLSEAEDSKPKALVARTPSETLVVVLAKQGSPLVSRPALFRVSQPLEFELFAEPEHYWQIPPRKPRCIGASGD